MENKYQSDENSSHLNYFPTFNINTISLIGVFSALCFGVLYLKIPIPSPIGKPMIHLGNMVVMLVSILFDGFTGGISGALGMGLYDILNGYGITSIKTIILKFGIGVICWTSYYLLKKNKSSKTNKYIFNVGFVFIVISSIFLFLSIYFQGKVHIDAINKDVLIPWSTYVFGYLIGTCAIIASFISKQYDSETQIVLFSCMIAVLFNLLGEFIGMLIYQLLAGANLEVSILSAIASLPATIINGTISIIIVVLIYSPLKKAIPQRAKKY